MDQFAQPSVWGQIPGWAYVLGVLFTGGGLWGWLKLLTQKRFEQWNRLWDHVLTQEREIGVLKAELERLKRRESSLVRAYRDLAAMSLREINRLRVLLKLPPITRWPPTNEPPPTRRRPANPNDSTVS